MKIMDHFTLRNRGVVFTMANDVEAPARNVRVVRARDGGTWPIRAIERLGINLGKPNLIVGEKIGLLMPDGCELEIGDDITIVPQ